MIFSSKYFIFMLLGVLFVLLVLLKNDGKGDITMQNGSYAVTLVHKAIVQENDWLNVSQPLTAQDLAGRIILLDFWTFCCINCMQVIPDLQYLEEKFGDALTVIGVHSAKFNNEKERDNIRSAILRYNIVHPVVNDKNFVIWNSFGVHAWPTLILINPDGKIENAYSGEGHRKAIENDIEACLKKYQEINKQPLPIALEKNKEPESILKFPGKLTFVDDYQGQPLLVISDTNHNRILGVRLTGEIIFEIGSGKAGNSDGSFTQAQFNAPQGVLYRDEVLYIADTHNHLIRKIDLKTKTVSTIAGTGRQGHAQVMKNKNALEVGLASPWDLVFFPTTSQIVIAMAGTHQLWLYDIDQKTISTFVGNGRESIHDGMLPDNTMSQPSGLGVSGDALFCVDSESSSLRKIDKDGAITTLIGTGLFDFGYAEGSRGKGLLQHPLGVCADGDVVYIADSYNHALRLFSSKTGVMSNFSGNGKSGNKIGSIAETTYNEPNAIVKGGNKFYIADTNNHRILVLDPEKDTVSELSINSSGAPTVRTISNDLPNGVKAPEKQVAAQKSITVTLQLPEHYKINDAASSWLALFKDGNVVQEYAKEDVVKKVLKLPGLEVGHYRLQATFYYCKDAEGSACLIQSYDQIITSDRAVVSDELEIVIGR